MTIEKAISLIVAAFRTHGEAAAWLGFGRDHWQRLRDGKLPIPPRTAYYIIGKAEELMASMQGVKTSAKGATNGD